MNRALGPHPAVRLLSLVTLGACLFQYELGALTLVFGLLVGATALGGKPALSFVADYSRAKQAMVEYCVYSLGESHATVFCTKLAKRDFDDFKDSFDAIVSTYEVR